MTEPKPFVCTLDGGALKSRLAEIALLAQRSLVPHQLSGRVLRLAFSADALDEVRRVVALEQRCCSFLDFSTEVTSEEIRLTITVPPGTDETARWLFAQFLSQTGNVEPAAAACGCTGQKGCW